MSENSTNRNPASRASGAVLWALVVKVKLFAIRKRQVAVWLGAGRNKTLWWKPHAPLQVKNASFSWSL